MSKALLLFIRTLLRDYQLLSWSHLVQSKECSSVWEMQLLTSKLQFQTDRMSFQIKLTCQVWLLFITLLLLTLLQIKLYRFQDVRFLIYRGSFLHQVPVLLSKNQWSFTVSLKTIFLFLRKVTSTLWFSYLHDSTSHFINLLQLSNLPSNVSVSYTHLTLPTSDLV